MKKHNENFILNQGYLPIIIALILAVFIKLFFIVVAILLYIFRNPQKSVVNVDENSIVSPSDGKIMAIDISKNKYKVYINVSLCDTHIVTAPKSANYEIKSYQYGLNLPSYSYKAKLLNSQAILKFDDIKVKLINGICATNIILYDDITSDIKVSSEIGEFLQGIVVVEIPKTYELKVNIGDKVSSGQSVLGVIKDTH